MKRLALFGLLALLPLVAALAWPALAADPGDHAEPARDVPSEATDEIARRGNLVEHVDGFQDADDPVAAIADALAVPQDDSNKWHITLVATKGCAACERLKNDFAHAPALQAWVNTTDYKKSWAHYQVVDIADPTQAWRWKSFRPQAFPTLIVQPPYDASWGDPHTVVYLRTGYDGKPEALSQAIRAALHKYAVKVFPRKLATEIRQGAAPEAIAFSDAGHGQSPPFVMPGPGPVQPQPYQPYPYPQIPPEVQPQPATPGGGLGTILTLLLGGLGLGQLFTMAMAAWAVYRSFAKATGRNLLIDDETFAAIRKAVSDAMAKPAQ